MGNVEKNFQKFVNSVFDTDNGLEELQDIENVDRAEVARLIYYLSKYLLDDSNISRCIRYAAYLKEDEMDNDFVEYVENSRTLRGALVLMHVSGNNT